jgi:hypothetical protein
MGELAGTYETERVNTKRLRRWVGCIVVTAQGSLDEGEMRRRKNSFKILSIRCY